MSGSTNLQQWNSGLANIETDAEYTADAMRTGGAVSGIFTSALANKLFYQLTAVVAGLGEALAAKGYTVNDGSAGTTGNDFAALVSVLGNLITYVDAVAYVTPTATGTVTPTALCTEIYPGALSASAIITIANGTRVGQTVVAYGSSSAYAATYKTSATSGAPGMILPDGTTIYSWTIPASSPGQGIRMVWDGTNWRCSLINATSSVVANTHAKRDANARLQAASGVTTNDVVNFGQFVSSLAAAGYQKLPSGLIIQWGSGSTTSGQAIVTLPTTFPNAILGGNVSEGEAQNWGTSRPSVYGFTNDSTSWGVSSITVMERNWNGSDFIPAGGFFRYILVGY